MSSVHLRVMKEDFYPSEKLIRTAMSLAFPELASDAACMSKQLKCVLNYMNQKRKAKKTGSRMHQTTSNILDWLKKHLEGSSSLAESLRLHCFPRSPSVPATLMTLVFTLIRNWLAVEKENMSNKSQAYQSRSACSMDCKVLLCCLMLLLLLLLKLLLAVQPKN
jgi:hypothetical protein